VIILDKEHPESQNFNTKEAAKNVDFVFCGQVVVVTSEPFRNCCYHRRENDDFCNLFEQLACSLFSIVSILRLTTAPEIK
jgi:hypothetical protein